MSHSYERSIRIYDNDTGNYVEVAPDSDGLGLVQINQPLSKTDISSITITIEEAHLLAKALIEVAGSINEDE